jgi:uncharacterized protein YcfJ
MNAILKGALALGTAIMSAQAAADVVFYEHDNFRGPSFTANEPVSNLRRFGFNNRASSAVVYGKAWERWEVCDGPRFTGRCVVLRPGGYPSFAAMGLNDAITSVREINRDARVENYRYAPDSAPVYDARRRPNEHLHHADVTAVHEVFSTPERRCWVEQQTVESHGNVNVPGAVLGAVVGGILGHQIGHGGGRDAATVGGAAVGGAIGAQAGRTTTATRDVQRCENVPRSGHLEYYDVTYAFRGQVHQVQMTYRPGPTILVNDDGEPRA